MIFRNVICIVSVAVLGLTAAAQTSSSAEQQATSPSYKINVSSRLVVEDVTVVDRNGRPVKGLPQSAFHVFDDDAAQQVLGFTETTGTLKQTSELQTANVHTNAALFRNQGTLVALLIDPMTIDLQDQMYLRLQALRFLDTAPEGMSIAVFRANNKGIPVLLQAPTSDRVLLRAAVTASVPILVRPIDSAFANAVSELSNLADYLRPVPGKKAVLWLAGKFPLYEQPDFSLNQGDDALREEALKESNRDLEQARVAVYPIDVRGILQGGLGGVPVVNTAAWENDPSTAPRASMSESAKGVGQYDAMDQLARATGGKAFYSNNAIAKLMSSAVELATDSYALSYRPQNYVVDGKYHKVRVSVEGPYTVQYRTGYYAAGPDAPGTSGERHVLNAMTAHTSQPVQPASAASGDAGDAGYPAPLIFSAKVNSAGKQGRNTLITVRYSIPSSQLDFGGTERKGHARFRLAVLAYNAWGDILSHSMDVVETNYTPAQMELAARIGTPADQRFEVKQGAQFLLLAVEDLRTERVGTLQLPLATVTGNGDATGH